MPSGNTNTLRPFFRVWVKVLTAFSDEVRLPRSTKMVPANSLIFPSKGTFRMLALLKNTMGVGLAANAALISKRLVWLATSTSPWLDLARAAVSGWMCTSVHTPTTCLNRGTLHPRRPMFHITQSPSTSLSPMATMPNALHVAV